jgi:hypothetical protein
VSIGVTLRLVNPINVVDLKGNDGNDGNEENEENDGNDVPRRVNVVEPPTVPLVPRRLDFVNLVEDGDDAMPELVDPEEFEDYPDADEVKDDEDHGNAGDFDHPNISDPAIVGECSICFLDIQRCHHIEGNCSHSFHVDCLNQWRRQVWTLQAATCPLCRKFFRRKNVIHLE